MHSPIRILYFAVFITVVTFMSMVQTVYATPASEPDSTNKAKQIADEAKVKSTQHDIQINIQNVDITRFPEVRLIVGASNIDGYPLDSIVAQELTVVENGKPKKVLSVQRISVKERIPIDFIFIIDITGTMQTYINGVKNNIERFVESLVSRGIDYRLGLVLFSDVVERSYQPTDNVQEFLKWISVVEASGGMDEPENALEALGEIGRMKFRPSANHVAVIITDAPYHQQGGKGNGRSNFTTESMTEFLKKNETQLFGIVPPVLKQYKTMAEGTRGSIFDITQPFSKILEMYSTQLTNLFAITYRSDQPAIPDSLNVGIVDNQKRELVRKVIPVVEIGRKLIIENLLFASNSSTLPDSVFELEILREFMTNKPGVVVRIEGHTDSKGSKTLNKILSLQRAESVKNYLIRKGVNPKRVLTEGLGDSRPIADNASDFGRRLNRRTEVVIIAK
ncbi:MAG: OmpA family protein [Ignavibacteriae bacterium]|nr:OmpA family protein [Ignavibacteriota bacterium]